MSDELRTLLEELDAVATNLWVDATAARYLPEPSKRDLERLDLDLQDALDGLRELRERLLAIIRGPDPLTPVD